MMMSDTLKRHCGSKHKFLYMNLTIKVEAKSKIGDSSFTDNNLELEILVKEATSSQS